MKTKSGMLLFAVMIAPASAQTTGNVMFSTGSVSGPAVSVGPGMATMAFVSGELSGNTVKGAPYSAQSETQSVQVLADGNRIVNTAAASVYRDSSGRERREQSMPGLGSSGTAATQVQTIMISDPVAGVNYSLNVNDRVAIKLPSPPPMTGVASSGAVTKAVLAPRLAVAGAIGMPVGTPMMTSAAIPAPMFYARTGSVTAGDAPKVEQLGAQLIEGVQTQGTRTTITIPAGQIGNDQAIQIVDETWRSPELQVIVQSNHSDPRMGTTSYTLRNISRNDPSPSLFQVPADYTIQEGPGISTLKGTRILPAPTAQ